MRWWGYKHTNGSYQAKVCWEGTEMIDIPDAEESPFVDQVCYPFEAEGRDEALRHIANELK